MIQYTMLWEGEDVKNVGNSKKDRGMGTIYQNKAELTAAAIVTIFGFIFIAAAIVTAFGNNSSCYYPQPWKLRH